MAIEITLDGLEEVQAKLGKLSREVFPRALKRFAEEIKLLAIPYPPEGPWNTPGPYPARWYQRHFGPRWALKSGGVGGRNTSERLQKQWLAEMRDPYTAVVANKASYADAVMGESQEPYHAAHGWRKLSDIAVENIGLWPEIVSEEIEKL